MAGSSQGERIAALEAQVARLGDSLDEAIHILGQRVANPAPSGGEMVPLLVALLDRMPNPAPPPSGTEMLTMALKLAKELNPKPAEQDPIAAATAMLGPVIQDVLSKRNGTQANLHDLTSALGTDGQNGP